MKLLNILMGAALFAAFIPKNAIGLPLMNGSIDHGFGIGVGPTGVSVTNGNGAGVNTGTNGIMATDGHGGGVSLTKPGADSSVPADEDSRTFSGVSGLFHGEAEDQSTLDNTALAHPNITNGVYLGSTKLDKWNVDRDILDLGQKACNLDRIQMTVDHANAHIDRLLVEYADGRRQMLRVKESFSEGSASRLIELNEKYGCIRKIIVRGSSTELFDGNAKLSFWGFPVPAAPAPVIVNPPTLPVEHFPCSEPSMAAIRQLKAGLSDSSAPTIQTADAIVAIGKSCGSTQVKVLAAEVLANGISNFSEPTKSVASIMVTLCGSNEPCAVAAVQSLAEGLSSYSQPTIHVVGAITEIVSRAPYPEVKLAAVNALAACISAYTSPTRECAAAMSAIGKCNLNACPR